MPEPTLALAAGTASFLSPCMLPVIPAFFAQLGGTSLGESSLRRRDVFLADIGEGAYEETEKKIQDLVKEKDRISG